jgi:hypothetical protein
MTDIKAAIVTASVEESSEDQSYAEVNGFSFAYVENAATWARRVKHYTNGTEDGTYALVVRDDQGCHYVSPTGRLPYSRPIALPSAALDRAMRISEVMRKADHHLVTFLEAWEDINELMYRDGGV